MRPSSGPTATVRGCSRARHVVVALAGMLAGALVLAACSGPTGGEEGGDAAIDDADTLTLGLTASPASLDYTSTGGAAIVQALLGNVYEGLVALGDDGAIRPLLATSWEISADGLRYTFALRTGVTFHDGTPLTPQAVAASLERVPQWTANSPGSLAAIDHVEVVPAGGTSIDGVAGGDAGAVVVVLSRADHDVLFRLAGPLGTVFAPASLADPASLATRPVGTGPFAFVSYRTASRLVLERNSDYWGAPSAVERVVLRYLSDANSAVSAVRTGGVDALYGAEAYDLLRTLTTEPDVRVEVGSTQGVVVLSMNPDGFPDGAALADLRVRQALSHAIDKQAVVQVATAGLGTVLVGPVVPIDPYARDLSEPYPFDPGVARQLLAEAGAVDLHLVLTVPNRAYALATAQVIQAQLRDVGVTVRLEQQEFPALWIQRTMVNRDFDLTVVNHVEPRSLWGYADPAYYWGYDSAVVRQALGAARAATSDGEYDADVTNAVEHIVADAPGVWLYNPPNVVVTRVGVSGLPRNDLGVGIALAGVTVDDAP